jgi:glutamyl-tRNA reductase
MFFIDLGVPRNFDPRLNKIENVFLYDIDDLEHVIEDNKGEREREAIKAESIIAEEVESFWSWLSSMEVTPTIVALREQAEVMRRREVEKTLASLKELPPHAQKAIEALSTAITNKLLHPPIAYLKSSSRNDENADVDHVATVRRMFGLENENE